MALTSITVDGSGDLPLRIAPQSCFGGCECS